MAPSRVAQGRGKRGLQNEKVKAPETAEATYDSDSYENHVIDLRGLQQNLHLCSSSSRSMYAFNLVETFCSVV